MKNDGIVLLASIEMLLFLIESIARGKGPEKFK